jgi:short-subunit dehydrogenase
MNSFTEGLCLELKSAGSPVKVQALCPGFTLSDFHDVMGIDRKAIPGPLWMKAEDVVEASLRGLERDTLFVVPGGVYKVIARLVPALPRFIRNRLVIRYSRRREHN